MTVYLDFKAQKCGYGRRIYTALVEKLKRMGVQNLYACVAYTDTEDEYLNKNSADFHAHLGFREVGKFRQCGYKFNRWYDMIWMEKIIGNTMRDHRRWNVTITKGEKRSVTRNFKKLPTSGGELF